MRRLLAPLALAALAACVNEPTSLVAGTNYLCGLDAAGSAWCWGSAASGQLGIGVANGAIGTPQPVSGGRAWRTIAAGAQRTCAIALDDVVWCWGASLPGNGEVVGSTVPVMVGRL